MDVTSLLRQSARANEHRSAIKAGGSTVTFGEAWRRGVQLANGLLAEGARPGDRVAVLEGNTLGAADMFLACAIGGFVRVPLYARNRRHSHLAMLNNIAATTLVIEESFAAELAGVRDLVPTLRRVLVRDGNYEGWLRGQSTQDPMVPANADDLLVIRHTGGTAADPLAAPFTHAQWWRTARDYYYLMPAPTPSDVCLHVGPISHASGYWFLPMWQAGATQVLVDGLDPDELLGVMEAERVSHMFMPPALLAILCRTTQTRTRDLSAIACMVLGSAPTTEATLRTARSIFGDVLYQLAGGTEAGVVVGMGPSEWFAELPGSRPMRAAGRLFPWCQVEIRDEQGHVLPPNAAGQVWSMNDGQIDGYLGAPQQTADRFRDGWVHIGDIGMLDENGYLYLLDRATDMIISGGFNIYPSELERSIGGLPDVIEAAVFGIPHDKWGETPAVVVRTGPDTALTEADVVAHVARELGSYKKPSLVVLQQEPLPRSPVGKLMRRALRAPYWQGRESNVSGS